MAKKNKFIFLAIITVLLTVACKKKQFLDVQGYISWVENPENNLFVEKKIGDFEFKVLYKPLDYIVSQEFKRNNFSKDSINKRKQELKDYQYYTLRIRSFKDNEFFRTGILTENEYYNRLEYFISEAQKDIKIIEGNDTIPCAMYHFERNYGISPYSSIVLSFEEKDSLNRNDKVFFYDDQVLGVGKIVIKLKSSDISDLPHLNY